MPPPSLSPFNSFPFPSCYHFNIFLPPLPPLTFLPQHLVSLSHLDYSFCPSTLQDIYSSILLHSFPSPPPPSNSFQTLSLILPPAVHQTRICLKGFNLPPFNSQFFPHPRSALNLPLPRPLPLYPMYIYTDILKQMLGFPLPFY